MTHNPANYKADIICITLDTPQNLSFAFFATSRNASHIYERVLYSTLMPRSPHDLCILMSTVVYTCQQYVHNIVYTYQSIKWRY